MLCNQPSRECLNGGVVVIKDVVRRQVVVPSETVGAEPANLEGEYNLTFANGWATTAFDSKASPLVVVNKNGICAVSGRIGGKLSYCSANGNECTVATLPTSCRPSKRLIFNLGSSFQVSRVDVLPDGQVRWIAGGSPGFTGLISEPGGIVSATHAWMLRRTWPVLPAWISLDGVKFNTRGGGRTEVSDGNLGLHGWANFGRGSIFMARKSGYDESGINDRAATNNRYSDDSFDEVAAYVDGKRCIVSGLVKRTGGQKEWTQINIGSYLRRTVGGAWGGSIMTLPENCRPSTTLLFNLNNNEATSQVKVTPDGVVAWVMSGSASNRYDVAFTHKNSPEISVDPRVPLRPGLSGNRNQEYIKNPGGTRCLDGNSDSNGGKVHMWNCEMLANQQWEYDPSKMQIKRRSGGTARCLQGDPSTDGGKVEMQECDTSSYRQQWRYGEGKKLCLLSNYQNPFQIKCLQGDARSNGGHVHMWRSGSSSREDNVVNWEIPVLSASAFTTSEGWLSLTGINFAVKSAVGCEFGTVTEKGAGTAVKGTCCPGDAKRNSGQATCKNNHPQMFGHTRHICWTEEGNNWGYCTEPDTEEVDVPLKNGWQTAVWQDNTPGKATYLFDDGSCTVSGYVKGQVKNVERPMPIIKNPRGTRCLDGNSDSNGGNVHMWNCESSLANQQWEYDPSKMQIKSLRGAFKAARCLQGDPSKDGGKVKMQDCDTSNFRQQWQTLLDNGSRTVGKKLCLFQTIYTRTRYRCLHGSDASSNGGSVYMWTYDRNNKDQDWEVPGRGDLVGEPATPGQMALLSQHIATLPPICRPSKPLSFNVQSNLDQASWTGGPSLNALGAYPSRVDVLVNGHVMLYQTGLSYSDTATVKVSLSGISFDTCKYPGRTSVTTGGTARTAYHCRPPALEQVSLGPAGQAASRSTTETIVKEAHCDCPTGLSGVECEICNRECTNGGVLDKGMCVCHCPRGRGGLLCDTCTLEARDCQNGGTYNKDECKCTCKADNKHKGVDCSIPVCYNGLKVGERYSYE